MKKNNDDDSRIIKINNYVKTKSDYLKIKRAQRISREIAERNIFLKKLNFSFSEEKMCRICFEEHNIEPNKLIRPCKCKGTQRFIHKECLLTWLNFNISNPEKRDYCDICKHKFKFALNSNTSSNYEEKKEENEIIAFNNNLINIDLSSKLINNSFKHIFFRNLKIIILAFLFSGIDINFDFFTLKVLSFFSCNRKCIFKRDFDYMFNTGNSSESGVIYYMYISYIICFIDTIFLYCYVFYMSKYKKIKTGYLKNYYDKKTTTSNTITYLTSHFFYLFFYISLLSNNRFFMQFMLLIYLFNIYNLESLIKLHNKTINSITLDVRNRELFISSQINNENYDDNENPITMDILEYKSEVSYDDVISVNSEIE